MEPASAICVPKLPRWIERWAEALSHAFENHAAAPLRLKAQEGGQIMLGHVKLGKEPAPSVLLVCGVTLSSHIMDMMITM